MKEDWKEIISVRLDPETIEKLRKQAVINGYTLSKQARMIIEKYYSSPLRKFMRYNNSM